jgi:D-alanine-D-alanine ligase
MKKNIAIFAGGDSGEYEISLKSGKVIEKNIDKNFFNTWFIHVKGRSWTYQLDDGKLVEVDKNDFSLSTPNQKIIFDAVFIAIHGTPGENGILQGYFELMKIPYTSSDVLTSALTFNKSFCNRVVKTLGVSVAPSVHLFADEEYSGQDIIENTDLPCFVKPCNSGSSVGMSKVNNLEELKPAIELAFKYDDQILIEHFIKGREITCGVFKTNGELVVLPITEVVSKKEFFDYEAKYTTGMAEEITPAPISEEIAVRCRETSAFLYRRLNCKGVVRFDYIFNENDLFFLEVNTIPGQSENSIVPQQARCMGLSITDLYTLLLNELF